VITNSGGSAPNFNFCWREHSETAEDILVIFEVTVTLEARIHLKRMNLWYSRMYCVEWPKCIKVFLELELLLVQHVILEGVGSQKIRILRLPNPRFLSLQSFFWILGDIQLFSTV